MKVMTREHGKAIVGIGIIFWEGFGLIELAYFRHFFY
jgi:hypothetical protein